MAEKPTVIRTTPFLGPKSAAAQGNDRTAANSGKGGPTVLKTATAPTGRPGRPNAAANGKVGDTVLPAKDPGVRSNKVHYMEDLTQPSRRAKTNA